METGSGACSGGWKAVVSPVYTDERTQPPWLDLSPFVSYILDAFERCLVDAALSINQLMDSESKLLERMNKAVFHAEITVSKAKGIVGQSEYATRKLLNRLVQKGYLTVDTTSLPYVYRL